MNRLVGKQNCCVWVESTDRRMSTGPTKRFWVLLKRVHAVLVSICSVSIRSFAISSVSIGSDSIGTESKIAGRDV